LLSGFAPAESPPVADGLSLEDDFEVEFVSRSAGLPLDLPAASLFSAAAGLLASEPAAEPGVGGRLEFFSAALESVVGVVVPCGFCGVAGGLSEGVVRDLADASFSFALSPGVFRLPGVRSAGDLSPFLSRSAAVPAG